MGGRFAKPWPRQRQCINVEQRQREFMHRRFPVARHLAGTGPQRAARLSLAFPNALSVVHFALLKTERIPEHVEHWAHQCRNVGSEIVDVEFR